LLASEKLKVVFDEKMDAPAKFDIMNRVLYICPLDDSQTFLIPGLVVHEVGHALFSILTEADVKTIGGRITKLLNIIDDGYQERMMCKKYPGAKQHLFTMFDHFFLNQKDDYYNTGSKVIDIVNTLNFNCKGAKHNHRKKYPDYVEKEDVALLHEAEMLNEHSMIKRWEFSKKVAEMLKKYGEFKDKEDDVNMSKSEDQEGESQEQTPEDDSQEQTPEDEIEEMLKSVAGELNDHHDKFKHEHGTKDIFELATGKELFEVFGLNEITDFAKRVDAAPVALRTFTAHNTIAKKNAQRIISEFNMRKAATDLGNTQYKKSGMLDPARAALYQIYDDVFETIAISPDQQSHAYVVSLDWSSSMSGTVQGLMFRIMELIHFAEGTGVELKVFAYTTAHSCRVKFNSNIATNNSNFLMIYDSNIHKGQLSTNQLKAFWGLVAAVSSGNSYGMPKLRDESKFSLAGTNILESYSLGHYLLSQMKGQKKTLLALTDGGDGYGFDIWYTVATRSSSNKKGKLYINGWYIKDDKHIKINSSKMVLGLYESVGQKTIGVAWATTPDILRQSCDRVISTGPGGVRDDSGYIHSENAFVREIVQHLI
jgi:hypothetical protein